jgi:hypothetical protein
MQIKPQTIAVAIQCVAAETRRIAEELDNDQVANPAETEQLLLTFDLAAADLKKAYEVALEQYGGLPAYDNLV